MLSLAPAANAGEWVQRSCSVGTEYIFPEGWESRDIEGYTETPNDNCERLKAAGCASISRRWTPATGSRRPNVVIQAARWLHYRRGNARRGHDRA